LNDTLPDIIIIIFIIIIIVIIIFFNKMPTKRSKYIMSKMSAMMQ